MNPEFFLRIEDGKIVLWDYVNHAQYLLDIEHFNRLVALSKRVSLETDVISNEIMASGILEHEMPKGWAWDCLSRIFHIGTQIRLKPGESLPVEDGYQGYVEYCQSISHAIPDVYTELPGEIISLPPPDLVDLQNKKFWQVLADRKTCRAFDGAKLSLREVATTLWATFGAVHGETRTDLLAEGLMPVGYRRTSPSGGSMQPSEAYLVALRVEGLAPGIYHYRSHKHELTLIQKDFTSANLGPLLCAQSFANELSFGVFITSRFDKLWWKYPHSRAYRVALLDVGCLTQTFQLVCESQGLQSWPTGYFFDHEINILLRLNEERESVLFFCGAGKGSGSVAREALVAARNINT